jgi:hypothetical protein
MKAEVKITIGKKHPYGLLQYSEFQTWFTSPNGNKVFGKLFWGSKIVICPPKGGGIIVSTMCTDVEYAGNLIHRYRVEQGWEQP